MLHERYCVGAIGTARTGRFFFRRGRVRTAGVALEASNPRVKAGITNSARRLSGPASGFLAVSTGTRCRRRTNSIDDKGKGFVSARVFFFFGAKFYFNVESSTGETLGRLNIEMYASFLQQGFFFFFL